ncbi:guanine nucleotide exchange factor [Anaeramoeba flamelloides]|uniref:Guanine nucleotide exchange factor n=1 Tax=Anaeramoeba flamelloides TaxID=1746091 RepID=A0AAV7ZRV6_9EUKA|nr:guanine nucleotide exchange factor [Anaeramoeba flamelloides]
MSNLDFLEKLLDSKFSDTKQKTEDQPIKRQEQTTQIQPKITKSEPKQTNDPLSFLTGNQNFIPFMVKKTNVSLTQRERVREREREVHLVQSVQKTDQEEEERERQRQNQLEEQKQQQREQERKRKEIEEQLQSEKETKEKQQKEELRKTNDTLSILTGKQNFVPFMIKKTNTNAPQKGNGVDREREKNETNELQQLLQTHKQGESQMYQRNFRSSSNTLPNKTLPNKTLPNKTLTSKEQLLKRVYSRNQRFGLLRSHRRVSKVKDQTKNKYLDKTRQGLGTEMPRPKVNELEYLFQNPLRLASQEYRPEKEIKNETSQIGKYFYSKEVPKLRSCTLQQLCKYLLYSPKFQVDFWKKIIYVHRNFTTKEKLFSALVSFFESAKGGKVNNGSKLTYSSTCVEFARERFYSLLYVWVDAQGEDFLMHKEWVNNEVKPFLQKHTHHFGKKQTSKLILMMTDFGFYTSNSRESKFRNLDLDQRYYPKPHLPTNINKSKFFDFPPIEIARQITILDFEIFSKIALTEFKVDNWHEYENFKKTSPNLYDFLYLFDRWKSIVISMILDESKVDKRVRIVEFWCLIAQELLTLRNYSTVFAIITALQSRPIVRLDLTWRNIPNTTRRIIDTLIRTTDKKNCFRKYRTLLLKKKKSQSNTQGVNKTSSNNNKAQSLKNYFGANVSPTIPLLDLYFYKISQILFLEKDFLDYRKTLINLQKFLKISNVLLKIQSFQNNGYRLTKIPHIRRILKKISLIKPINFLKRSTKIEKPSTNYSSSFLFGSDISFITSYEPGLLFLSPLLRQPIKGLSSIMKDKIEEEEKFIQQFIKIDPQICIVETSNGENDPNNGNGNGNNNEILNVSGGTVDWLIKYLTTFHGSDTDYLQTFLLTYRDYITPIELLEKIKQRYLIKPPGGLKKNAKILYTEKIIKKIKLKIITVLNSWIRSYFFDFKENPDLCEKMLQFIDTTILKDEEMKRSGIMIKAILNKMLKNDGQLSNTHKYTNKMREMPKPILPKDINNFSFMDIDRIEITRQITIYEFEIFKSIQSREFLNQNWTKKNKLVLSPNILKMTKFFNSISNWLANEALSIENLKNRAQYLTVLISISREAKKIGNFNLIQEINSSFNTSAIYRLKKTQEMIPNKAKDIWIRLSALINRKNNFGKMRTVLQRIIPPAFPYVGMYLTDLVFNDEGNPNNITSVNGNRLINFEKRKITANIIKQIQQFQQTPYMFEKVPQIQSLIHKNTSIEYDSKKMYQQSLKVEPREPKN